MSINSDKMLEAERLHMQSVLASAYRTHKCLKLLGTISDTFFVVTAVAFCFWLIAAILSLFFPLYNPLTLMSLSAGSLFLALWFSFFSNAMEARIEDLEYTIEELKWLQEFLNRSTI